MHKTFHLNAMLLNISTGEADWMNYVSSCCVAHFSFTITLDPIPHCGYYLIAVFHWYPVFNLQMGTLLRDCRLFVCPQGLPTNANVLMVALWKY